MSMTPSTLCFRRVTHLGLTAQAINFAQSSFMGHRVLFNVPVDFMNEYFRWTRMDGELRPTGRFVANPAATYNGSGPSAMPSFITMLERAFQTAYTDIDGVAQGLNYSSPALDSTGDMKRDVVNITNESYIYDPTGAGTSTPVANQHYSVNDLVMAFVLNKCFGSSSFDAWDVVYNLQDAFGMLSNQDLATAIKDSLQEEEDKATANVAPIKSVNDQLPGDDKGRVDEMFRSLLSMDPQRFYKNGSQIPGLFESNPDVAGSGNWCLGVGDKIEIPVRLYFRAPVTVLSVVDNAKNPSSATPDQVETVFIKGEGIAFDATNPAHVAAADRGNAMSLRLQLVCSAPVMDYPVTRSSSEEIGSVLDLQVVNKTSLVFYYGAHYPTQTAIAVVVAGGTAPYTYSFQGKGTSGSPPGVSIDSTTGIISFDPTDPAAIGGRWDITISITAQSGSINTDIFITVDSSAGSTPSGGGGLIMPAPTSTLNFSNMSPTGNNTYSIGGYNQSLLNNSSADLINFNSTNITGTWSITASVDGGTPFPVATLAQINIVRYTASTGELTLTSADPLYPPTSTVVFTATLTRTSDGAVGSTVLTVLMPITELILNPSTNINLSSGKYEIGDPTNAPYYIDVTILPYAIAGETLFISTPDTQNSLFADVALSTHTANRIELTNTVWNANASTHYDSLIQIDIDYKSSGLSVLAAPVSQTISFLY
jgi:hypothetical protein